MRKHVDKALRRLGYARLDHIITGTVEFKLHEQPFVNLTLPGGQRVCGWVDSRLPFLTYGDNPPPVHGVMDAVEHERAEWLRSFPTGTASDDV
jgi:hypothetical protein